MKQFKIYYNWFKDGVKYTYVSTISAHTVEQALKQFTDDWDKRYEFEIITIT